MRKTEVLLLAVFSLIAGQLSAQPDLQDSVILESKVVAPGQHPGPATDTAAYVYQKVYITNKDSLSAISIAVIERSLSGGAYAILGRPRNINGVLNRLTTTLRFFTVVGVAGYNSTSPDSFNVAGVYDPTDLSTAEPPNPVRKPFYEFKYDSVTTVVLPGEVEFDLSGVVNQPTGFVDVLSQDVPVNFKNGITQVGVPLQLDLISPANAAVVPDSRPTFVWHSLRDTLPLSATYTVFLADNPAFAPTDTSPSLADTTWQVPIDLALQTTYYWKVRAITPGPDTAFSGEVRSFRLDAAPSPPVDISPPNGSDLSMFDYLVWLEGSDPDPGDLITYQLQIDDNANFSSPEVDQSNIDENTTALTTNNALLRSFPNALAIQLSALDDHDNLKDDSTYFWRVRAVDNHGGMSAYTSGQRKFFLNLADSSPRPVLGGFSPAGGVVLTTHRPDFSWFAASDPDPDDPPSSLRYHLRLDTDGEITSDFQFNFATPPGETTLVPLDSLAENGHWFWGVRAVDSKGARSTFSAIQDFYINAVNEPPNAFSLLAPADSAFTVTRMPTLDWEDAADPDPFDVVSYEVVISSFANFDSAFTASGILASAYTVQAGALAVRGQLYYWKIRAIDNANLTTESNQVLRFTLLKLGDANRDGLLTSADIVALMGFVFLLDPLLDPPEVADLNCDGTYTLSDIVLALNAVFLGQEPPCDP